MDYVAGVQELQRPQTLLADARDLRLAQHRLRDHVGEGATLQVLHDDPQELGLLRHQVALHVVDDGGMLVVLHHFNLRHDQFLLRLLLQVHHLDGDTLPCLSLLRQAHVARRTGGIEGILETSTHVARCTGGIEGTLETSTHVARRTGGIEGTLETSTHVARRTGGIEGTLETSTHVARRTGGIEATLETSTHVARRTGGIEGTLETSTHG